MAPAAAIKVRRALPWVWSVGEINYYNAGTCDVIVLPDASADMYLGKQTTQRKGDRNGSNSLIRTFLCAIVHGKVWNLTHDRDMLKRRMPTQPCYTEASSTPKSVRWEVTTDRAQLPWQRSWYPWTFPSTRWSRPPVDSRWCKGWRSPSHQWSRWYPRLCGTRNMMWGSSFHIP